MSLVKQLAGQTVIYGLGQILPRIFHFIIFSTYLTYRLSDNRIEYAVYLDLYAYASILIVLLSYRMDTALFRFGRKKEDLDTAYQTALLPLFVSSGVLLVLGNLFSENIAHLLTYPGKGYYVCWFSWIIAFDVLILLPMAKLRLEDRARRFVFIKIGNVLITVLLVLFFLELLPRYNSGLIQKAGSDIDFVFLANLIASALVFLYLMITGRPQALHIDWSLWNKMFKYALPLVIVGIAGSINQFFGVPLQKYFLGASYEMNKDQAAVYGAVQKIPALLAMFTTAYNYAAEPFFFKNYDQKDAKALYGDIALFFIVAAGFIILVLFFGIDLFAFLIGPSFREGLYLVPILLFAYLFLGTYYNVSIWYKLADKTHYGAGIATIGAIITIAGSLVFLPILGVSASAWVAVACYAAMVVMAYVLGQRYYPIEYPVKHMIFQITLLVLIITVGYFLRSDQIVINLLIGLGLILFYGFFNYKITVPRLRRYL